MFTKKTFDTLNDMITRRNLSCLSRLRHKLNLMQWNSLMQRLVWIKACVDIYEFVAVIVVLG